MIEWKRADETREWDESTIDGELLRVLSPAVRSFVLACEDQAIASHDACMHGLCVCA